MTLVVTGATGNLGRLVVENLLDRGVPAADIIATGRSLDRRGALGDRGVQLRAADYADPATLRSAFAGAHRVLLVSGSEPGARVEQHRNAVEAAREAGVELLAYTSIVNADTSTMRLAEDHQATEALLRASGVPFVLLRNGWYTENYTDHLAAVLEHGALFGSAGEGRVNTAPRADYAAAAAAVLTTDGHAGKAYELGGDEAFTLAELAAEISAGSGTPVGYTDLPEADYVRALTGNGVPQVFAEILADADQGLRRGELATTSGDLARLIGRPTVPLKQALNSALNLARHA
ncbi:SDR family oxidoreductase [Streptacidiphilus fuscans]|uniref:SDR family oxidoreductase n=1 Tax=Streptacidiphilus fuscans TaxID=2789292 RepID=A0A931FDI1_9ACTN|nr:SDR family oxidoreductase [Streptacidiphilus fuscans]MBF9066529.1 SDR family oxidoreductase [Streptacidiphilus fuscans]